MTESYDPAADPLAFTPVVTASRRHDGWTLDRQRRFIDALAVMGVVAAAARAVGKSATAAYDLRARPDAGSFAAAWDIARLMGQDRQYEQAMRRATDGYEAPRYYAGRQVGTVRRYDHRLAFAALRHVIGQAPPAAPGYTADCDKFDKFGPVPPHE